MDITEPGSGWTWAVTGRLYHNINRFLT